MKLRQVTYLGREGQVSAADPSRRRRDGSAAEPWPSLSRLALAKPLRHERRKLILHILVAAESQPQYAMLALHNRRRQPLRQQVPEIANHPWLQFRGAGN